MPYWYYDNTRPQHSNLTSERPRRWSTGRCLPTSSTPCYTRLKKHDFPKACARHPVKTTRCAPAAVCLIPRTQRRKWSSSDLTEISEENRQKHQNPAKSCVHPLVVKSFCQFGDAQHEKSSSRYEKWIWRRSGARITPGRRAIECEDGHLREREKECRRSVRQPLHLGARNFDADGGAAT